MEIDFEKMNGLVPAIIQDNVTGKVLMLGFMNQESYKKTLELGKVTFYSRTKKRLWTKGEESGNFLNVVKRNCLYDRGRDRKGQERIRFKDSDFMCGRNELLRI